MKQTTWEIDPTHSEIQFKVKHLMISAVTGQFKKFSGNVKMEGDDISTAKVYFTAEISSISTNNEQRDAHLRNNDFFDESSHPSLVFESSKMEKADEERYQLHGLLTMRGITRAIVLDTEFGGTTKDPWGNTRVGFTVNGSVNRKDYGISFSMISETGGLLLGEEVKINASVQFVKQPDPVLV